MCLNLIIFCLTQELVAGSADVVWPAPITSASGTVTGSRTLQTRLSRAQTVGDASSSVKNLDPKAVLIRVASPVIPVRVSPARKYKPWKLGLVLESLGG